jgi:hypothetical protein
VVARNKRNKPGKPVIISAESWATIIDKVMAGPGGTITHVAPNADGELEIVPDPDMPTQLVQ